MVLGEEERGEREKSEEKKSPKGYVVLYKLKGGTKYNTSGEFGSQWLNSFKKNEYTSRSDKEEEDLHMRHQCMYTVAAVCTLSAPRLSNLMVCTL